MNRQVLITLSAGILVLTSACGSSKLNDSDSTDLASETAPSSVNGNPPVPDTSPGRIEPLLWELTDNASGKNLKISITYGTCNDRPVVELKEGSRDVAINVTAHDIPNIEEFGCMGVGKSTTRQVLLNAQLGMRNLTGCKPDAELQGKRIDCKTFRNN